MKKQIIQNVKIYISLFANFPIDRMEDDSVLQKKPLKLDSVKLAFLALSLRGYVKGIKPSETVLVKELRKKDFTVKNTFELIIEKVI